MEYKKIFDLNLNNKKFTIFIDDKGRFTFLEKNNKGEYIYPLLEDFLFLHNVYNNVNPFILYDVNRYSFEEKVRYGIATTMAVVTLLTTSINFGRTIGRLEANVKDGEVVISESPEPYEETEPYYVAINKPSDLDRFFDSEKITPEVVREAINNNENLPKEYKILCHMLLNEISSRYPEADLGVFYLNVKDLKIREITSDDLQKEFKQAGIAANFDVNNSTINIDSTSRREFKAHEIAHNFTVLSKEIDDKYVYKTCTYGHSLDEAMNNKLASLVVKTNSYYQEEAIIDFLSSCVEYDIADYINYGIDYLIISLKNKYPDVDIDFIVKTIDAIKTTNVEFGVVIPFDANMSFIDELFSICQKNVNAYDNCYTAFTKFARVLDYANDRDLVYTYLDRYNEYLKSIGINNIVTSEEVRNKAKELQNISGFAFYNDSFYPLVNHEEVINGNKLFVPKVYKDGEYLNPVGFGEQEFLTRKISYLTYSYPENKDIYNTSLYWEKMAFDTGTFSIRNIKPMRFYYNGEYIGEEFYNKVNVQFGLTNLGEIAYKLVNQNNDIIYASSDDMNHLSAGVSLKTYYETNSAFNSLELTNIFNEDYLKLFIKEKNGLFSNISVVNDKVVIEPKYMLKLNNNGIITYIDVLICKFNINEDGKIELYPYNIVFDIDGDLEYYPTLKEILNHNHILDTNQTEYSMEYDEFMRMIKEYLGNLSENKVR